MNDNDNDKLYEKIVTAQEKLDRFGNRHARDVAKFLLDLEKSIVDSIVTINALGTPRTDYQKKRTKRLFSEIAHLILETYREIWNFSKHELAGLAEIQSSATAKILGAVAVETATALVSKSAINAIISEATIEGGLIWEQWQNQVAGTKDSVKKQLRMGLAIGETTRELANRIIGGKDSQGISQPGIMKLRRDGAERLALTAANAVGNETLLQTYKKNSDIIEGTLWSATLDKRTCMRCASKSDMIWTLDSKGSGHSEPFQRPPLHPRCRCVLVPVMHGDPPQPLTFKGWFEKRSKKEQIEIMGPARFKLWQSGKIGIREMSDDFGRLLTLDELKKII